MIDSDDGCWYKQVVAREVRPGYDPRAVRVHPLLPAFTRRREAFIGRLAQLGFVGCCAVEVSS